VGWQAEGIKLVRSPSVVLGDTRMAKLNAISTSYSTSQSVATTVPDDHSLLRIESDVELYVTNRGDG